ncbi:MAG: YceI family protein [Actinobacteria bacterium]|nr:YceI family protein [Actinomycetota bacterium]
MSVESGHYRLGPGDGRLVLRTFRDGLAARAGHDLTIEATRWSGDLTVGAGETPSALDVRIEMGSLVVREGTGGVKPLTDRDRREIAVIARKTLAADRHPEATFTADGFDRDAGGWQVTGSLTLAGRTRPLRLRIAETRPEHYQLTASVTQSDFGIKPYTGFMGALRVRDAVDIEAEGTLPAPDGAAADGETGDAS